MKNYPIGVSLEAGLEMLLAHCVPLPAERVLLEAAEGRVLAADVTAKEDIPPFRRSPYDGYALRAEDTAAASPEHGVTLSVVEEIPAGHAPAHPVCPGQAAKILTGAPVPEGVDAIVKFEDTEFTAETVTIFSPCRSGENVVPAGEDIRQGSVVMRKGTVLDSARLGILAGLGRAVVDVYRRPKVELIPTGSELVPKESPLRPGKIRNSSVYALSSYIARCGGQCRCAAIAPDRAETVAEAIESGLRYADIVMTTGGASVGDYDVARAALERLGAEILFWKLQIKPGMAFVAAVCRGKLVLCLSGNPSAAAVALFLLGIPVLRKLGGRREVALRTIRLKLANPFPKKSPVRRFLPGRLIVRDGAAYLEQNLRQGNGMLRPLVDCELLGEIPAGSPPMEAGAEIRAYCLFR